MKKTDEILSDSEDLDIGTVLQEGHSCNRRAFLKETLCNALTLKLLGVAGLSCQDKKKEVNHPGMHSRTSNGQQQPKSQMQPKIPQNSISPIQAKKVEFEVDKGIRVPDYELKPVKVSVKKPKNLTMDEVEFENLSIILGENLKRGIHQFLNPNLKKAGKGGESKLFLDFIQQTAMMIQASEPAAGKEMIDFSKIWDKDPTSLCDHINEYLKPAELYIHFLHSRRGFEMSIHSIQKTSVMIISNDEGTEGVDVLHLGKNLVYDPEPDVSSLASSNLTSQVSLVFETKVENMTRKTWDNFSEKVLKEKMTFEEFKKTLYMDVLQHECTHIFLAKKFPKVGKMRELNEAYKVSLDVSIGNGNNIGLSDIYPPVMFGELACLGIQIARSGAKVPFENVLYLVDNVPTEYFLVSKVLPLAILQEAYEGPEKDKLLDQLSRGGLQLADVRALVLNEKYFSMGNARKVGKIMYRLGFKLMQKAERGEFEEVVR